MGNKSFTRTATISVAITEEFLPVSSLLDSNAFKGDSFNYEDIFFENVGDTDIYIASMEDATVPSDAHRNTIAANGGGKPLKRANLSLVYIKSADENGTNFLEFVGTPKE